ncbi:hypothetical protein EC988_000789 [Linderina pennispora]|nr:hypothetical protein EC988_000789 [Linderina pennispora]
MDTLGNSIQTETIQLGPIDAQFTSLTAPLVFIYGNPDSSAEFMPTDKLKRSLYSTLQRFPVLVGRLKEKQYGLDEIIIDKDDLNLPTFDESTSDIHYDDIKANNFHWTSWPPERPNTMSLVIHHDVNSRARLLQIHISRLRDNSGVVLSVSILHSIMDGHGLFAFMNDWSRTCRLGDGTSPVAYVLNRNVITDSLPADRKPIDKAVFDIFSAFNPVAELLAWVSHRTRSWVLKKGVEAADGEAHFFRIPGNALDRLRSAVRQHVPQHTRISNNDLLVSLICHTIARAQKEVSDISPQGAVAGAISSMWEFIVGKKSRHFGSFVVCDIRCRVDILDKNYMGNAVVAPIVQMPLDRLSEQITVESLAHGARSVRSTVDNIDGQYVRGYLDAYEKHPTAFARSMVASGADRNLLSITNVTRFNVYDSDFGYGRPAWVCPPPVFAAGVAVLLPSAESTADVVAYVIAEKPVMERVLENRFWMDVVKVIN